MEYFFNQTEQFFRAIRNSSRFKQKIIFAEEDEEGNLLADTEEVKTKWKYCFERMEMLNELQEEEEPK